MVPRKGESASAATRRATDARRAKVSAATKDRASQRQRIEAWRRGEYPMSDWTDVEVLKGRVGSAEGDFYGAPVKMTAKEQKQLTVERRRRAMLTLEQALPYAVGTVKDVMAIGFPADRLRAANMVIERGLGKVPERIVELADDPYADMMDDVFDDDRSDIGKSKPKRKKR